MDFAPRHYFDNTPVVTIQYRGAARRWKLIYTTFLKGAWYFGVKTADDTHTFEVLQADVALPADGASPEPVAPPPDVLMASLIEPRPPVGDHRPVDMLNIVGPAHGLTGARGTSSFRVMHDGYLEAMNAATGFPSPAARPQITDSKHIVSITGDGRHEITIDGRKHTVTSAELRDMTGGRLQTMTLEEIAALLILREALGKNSR